MAPVLRQGWELDNANNSSVIFKAKTYQAVPAIPGRQELVEIVNNTSTGNFDIYETRLIGPRPDKPIFSYNASNDKITIVSQDAYNKYYAGTSGKKQFESILKSAKEATFDLSQINTGTDPVSNANFEVLKSRPGYQSLANKAKGGERAAPPGGSPPGSDPQGGNTELTPDQQKEFDKEKATIKGNTRGKYDSVVVYPIGLDSTLQDCIKFSIIEYKQSGLTGFAAGDENLRRIGVSDKIPKPLGKDRTVLSTIVLPIPGGIQDTNTVNWSGLDLPDLQQALGSVMATGIMGGNVAEEFRKQAEAGTASGSGARTAIVSNLIKGVLGDGGVMQRQFGTIINPNLELLFNNPDLRTFSFSFKLSPRSSKEAENVKKIIRYFKQAMSVKRSKSSMLLQTPHTFGISYIFQNKEHPYLNKFKECALTSCSVNYTPEGNYMSFDDSNQPSMVSYQLDLQFQELEPLYDDDYTASDGDSDKLIGY